MNDPLHSAAGQPEVPARSPASFPTAAVAPWWHTLLLVVLVAGGSLLQARQAHHVNLAAHHAGRYLTGILAEWLLFLLLWWGLRLKRVPLAQVLGFRRGLRAFGQDMVTAGVFWILALMVLSVIGIVLQLAHLGTPQKTLAALAPQNAVEVLLWIALSCSAGFVEELAFRGYLLRQFSSPLHAIWLGIVASSLE